MKKLTKKITPRDAVLGIGRPATEEELDEYLNRQREDKFTPIGQVREEITEYLTKRNQGKKAS